MRRLLLPLLFALGLHAQDAATVARMVNADAVDPAVLEKALQLSDALVRSTAARVAMVRNVPALVMRVEGCVRDLRLVQQTIHPELNRAALETLSKWTFEPGTLNGVPVDVLFNLTITFRH